MSNNDHFFDTSMKLLTLAGGVLFAVHPGLTDHQHERLTSSPVADPEMQAEIERASTLDGWAATVLDFIKADREMHTWTFKTRTAAEIANELTIGRLAKLGGMVRGILGHEGIYPYNTHDPLWQDIGMLSRAELDDLWQENAASYQVAKATGRVPTYPPEWIEAARKLVSEQGFEPVTVDPTKLINADEGSRYGEGQLVHMS